MSTCGFKKFIRVFEAPYYKETVAVRVEIVEIRFLICGRMLSKERALKTSRSTCASFGRQEDAVNIPQQRKEEQDH